MGPEKKRGSQTKKAGKVKEEDEREGSEHTGRFGLNRKNTIFVRKKKQKKKNKGPDVKKGTKTERFRNSYNGVDRRESLKGHEAEKKRKNSVAVGLRQRGQQDRGFSLCGVIPGKKTPRRTQEEVRPETGLNKRGVPGEGGGTQKAWETGFDAKERGKV